MDESSTLEFSSPQSVNYRNQLSDLESSLNLLLIECEKVEKELSVIEQKGAGTEDAQEAKKRLQTQRKVLELEIRRKKEKINDVKSLLHTSQKVESIAASAEQNLQTLQREQPTPMAANLVIELKQQVYDLAEQNQQLIRRQASQPINNFIPKFSIITPKIKLVDANLAYKFADLQSDTNIFIGLATLALGTTISTVISLMISNPATIEKTVIAVYWAVTLICAFFSIAFGLLALRAYKKAEKTKAEIETDAGEKDIALRFWFGMPDEYGDTMN